jgi:hypothetical protein
MRKLTKFWEAICGGAEKTKGILGIEVEGSECGEGEVCEEDK